MHIRPSSATTRQSKNSVAHPERARPSPASAVGAKVVGRDRTIILRPCPPPRLLLLLLLLVGSASPTAVDPDPGGDPARSAEATPTATPPNASTTLDRSATSSIATSPCLRHTPLPGLKVGGVGVECLALLRTRQCAGLKYLVRCTPGESIRSPHDPARRRGTSCFPSSWSSASDHGLLCPSCSRETLVRDTECRPDLASHTNVEN